MNKIEKSESKIFKKDKGLRKFLQILKSQNSNDKIQPYNHTFTTESAINLIAF